MRRSAPLSDSKISHIKMRLKASQTRCIRYCIDRIPRPDASHSVVRSVVSNMWSKLNVGIVKSKLSNQIRSCIDRLDSVFFINVMSSNVEAIDQCLRIECQKLPDGHLHPSWLDYILSLALGLEVKLMLQQYEQCDPHMGWMYHGTHRRI